MFLENGLQTTIWRRWMQQGFGKQNRILFTQPDDFVLAQRLQSCRPHATDQKVAECDPLQVRRALKKPF